ncbi:MAG: ECF transporter S component, partial [Oscillospiraceae bacterium]|nr:ECF transporter S component [Oscillospiraceae bacterium]
MKTTSLRATKTLCAAAVAGALVCLATMVIQIPIPLGYAHLGDCLILVSAWFLPPAAA